jgi:LSD1 subclass zinc finger protein
VPPTIDRIPRHTIITNWAMVHGRIGPDVAAHLQTFLNEELVTTSSVNAEEQLILRGFWKVDDLRSLMRRYVATYKQCRQCHGYNTELVTVDGVEKVRCARCRTDNAID